MSNPLIISPGSRSEQAVQQAVKSQLADFIALQRSDATPRELARMYAVSVTAYRAANLRAMVVSNIPYKVVDKKTGETLPDHPLNALLRDNPDLPDVLERSEITSCFWGHNLVYKRRAQRQRVTALQWINPQQYRLKFDLSAGQLVGFDVSAQWSAVDYDEKPPEGFITRQDAIYTHGVDFDNDFDGVAPAENAFDHAGIETEAAQTAVWFLRNRAVPAGLLQPKDNGQEHSPPGDSDVRFMKRLVNRILRGARNAGKTIVSKGRWEWVLLQHRFDQVEFSAQHKIAREGVSMAFDVPLDLLLPTSSTYAELYQSNKSWVEYFAKNRCRWYARHLTKQLAPEFGDDIRIEPDFTAVFQQDDAQLVEVTNDKLLGGYFTLYAAQVATGNEEPDERLKDIYIVGNEPVHIDRLVRIAQEGRAASWPALDMGDENGDGDPGGAPNNNGEGGDEKPQNIESTQGLNGAQIKAAMDILDGVRAGTTAPEVAVELLMTLGIEPDRAAHMVELTPAGEKVEPSSFDEDDDPEKPTPAQKAQPSAVTNVTPDDPDWLPDDLFKELRDCVRVTARRGADYAFEPVVLPVDVVAYTRLLVALDGPDADQDTLIAAARSYYHSTAEWRAMKAYADVEAQYRAALYDLLRRAFARQLDQAALERRGHDAIDTAYEAAFKQGLADVGTSVVKLSGGETAFLNEQAQAERRYWTRLAGEVAERLVKVQDEIEAVRQQLAAATDPDEQEQLRAELLAAKQKLIANRDVVLNRIDLWVQALRRIYSQGQLSGERNPMMTWQLDEVKENCRTCLALDGQVHRASEFAALGLYPGSMALECVSSAKGVPVCGCAFKVVPGARPKGNLASVPLFGSARSLGVNVAAKTDYGAPSGTVLLMLDQPDDVIAFQNQLIDTHPALCDARWTPDDQLHITLVHSALVTDDAFADIFADATLDGVPSFDLRASSLEAFELDGNHRAVVLRVAASDELRAFQRRVYDAFVARGIPVSEYSDPNVWKPHITLYYERAQSDPFEPRDVAVTAHTGDLVFSRGDYRTVHTLPAGTLQPMETGDSA